jgi:hypothetical protein
VTGSYEAKSDCSITWKLQDTSGAFQNFSGTLSPDAASVQFKQTDPGGAPRGIMKKTSDACSAATPMQPDETSHLVSGKGTLDPASNGSFQVDSDCSVRFVMILPAQDGQVAEPSPIMNMRGFLVDGGKEILAFQTDPGTMVSARFTSDER